MKKIISDATEKNWQRLHSDYSNRLTSRANKRLSEKEIFPEEYLLNEKNIETVKEIVDFAKKLELSKEEIILSLGYNILKYTGIFYKEHVQNVLEEYKNIEINNELENIKLPVDERDLLGLIYQTLLTEGEKNIAGSYYTPQKVISKITKKLSFSNGETFFDPCCGSGSYLLDLEAYPEQIYAVDKDSIAVMIAKINLLIKFPELEFKPQVFCRDFLENGVVLKKFDYIATNPPWGAMAEGKMKESFSEFFMKSYYLLKNGGIMNFLLPESVLNVKKHKNLREFMINNCCVENVTLYDRMFSGVLTKYVNIEVKNCSKKEKYIYSKNGKEKEVSLVTVDFTKNKIFNFIDAIDEEIIRKVKEKGVYYLNKSTWALGIVTGNNQKMLKDTAEKGLEMIYTGKEVEKFKLKMPKKYIEFKPEKFQQIAREEYYRTEKLIYKFISEKPVFAYDDSKSLVLNSANVLIPKIPGMSVKTVMAFLNSEVFEYLYKVLFGEVKILRGNLEELPFPSITEKENVKISQLVDGVINGNDEILAIENEIYNIFELTKYREYINNELNN